MNNIKQGLIIKAISGFYYVESEQKEYDCKARGIFRKNGTPPLVGDTVKFSLSGDSGVIEEILPRKNELARPPIANLDRLYIVSSFVSPAPNLMIIDKIIALSEHKGIEPVVVFNKCDTGDFSELAQVYRNAGYIVFIVSCKSGEGIDELKADFAGNICALTGNSGVGKSSLLNIIMPELSLKTGEISEKLGRGRHTTRSVKLYKHQNGGYIADTPGFSSIEFDPIPKDTLACCYREFNDYLGNCKFTSCSHTGEKGCAIFDALKQGKIAQSRFDSYVAMYKESAAVKEWENKK